MDLNSLSKEDLLIVTSMLLEGKTMEDIKAKFVPTQLQSLVHNVHTLLCNDLHIEGGCQFHIEKSFEEPERKKWLAVTNRLIEAYSLTEEDMKNALAISFKITSDLKNTIMKYDPDDKAGPLIMDLLHRICENYLDTYNEPSQNPE